MEVRERLEKAKEISIIGFHTPAMEQYWYSTEITEQEPERRYDELDILRIYREVAAWND